MILIGAIQYEICISYRNVSDHA